MNKNEVRCKTMKKLVLKKLVLIKKEFIKLTITFFSILFLTANCSSDNMSFVTLDKSDFNMSSVDIPESVIILGPNHTGCGPQASIMESGSWQMPMGNVNIDQDLAQAIILNSDILQSDISAQMLEHSIEVQVPFLQYFHSDIKIVPIILGGHSLSMCKSLAHAIVQGINSSDKDILIVASTDLTHYKSQTEANQTDYKVIDKILNLDARGLFDMVIQEGISMCGVIPVTVALLAATEIGGSSAEIVRYTDSGEVSGDTDQVVGYAGVVIS